MNDLREGEHDIRKQIAQMLANIDNTSFEALMNMPSDDRDMLVKAHNAKIEKMNSN